MTSKTSVADVIAANTVILELHVRGPVFKKGVSSKRILDRGNNGNGNGQGLAVEDEISNENSKINPDHIHISKDLIDQRQLKAIRDLTSQFTTKLKFYTLPTGMLAHGLYRLATKSVNEVDELIEQFIGARQAELEKFVLAYPELIAQAEKDLGPEFSATDYPPIDKVIKAYRVDVAYYRADVPVDIEEISRSILQREREKQEVTLRGAYEEIQVGLRSGFAQLIETFARQLGTDATGKKRKLYDSTLEKINLFLNTFSARNMTDDRELAKLVDQARDLVNGKDTKAIKGSDPMRAALQSGFDKISATVGTMVEVKARKFSLASDV